MPWVLEHGLIEQKRLNAKCQNNSKHCQRMSMDGWPPRIVRYIVHNYFQKEHGWLIQGLEPTGTRANVSELHSAHIIQNKAPAILEAILEDRQDRRELDLSDAVAMMTALEHLIFEESVVLLERAYALNDLNGGVSNE